MKEATAFSPGHITGFFQICRDPASPLRTGSRGAGISISRGVTTSVAVEPAAVTQLTIFINNVQKQDATVSLRTWELFMEKTALTTPFQVTIRHTIGIPLGCGLGSSGAGALSLIFALNEAFQAGLTFDEAVGIAHRAEVELKTGLGTVMGEAYGGVEIREEAGAPGFGRVSHIPLDDEYRTACLVFGSLSTSAMLSDPQVAQNINRAGKQLIDEIIIRRSLECFMNFSRQFALHTGLVNARLQAVLAELEAAEIPASMLMFGDGLFILEKAHRFSRVEAVLEKYAARAIIIISDIDIKGVRILCP